MPILPDLTLHRHSRLDRESSVSMEGLGRWGWEGCDCSGPPAPGLLHDGFQSLRRVGKALDG